MIPEHKEKLEDIAACCNLKYKALENTYNRKITNYMDRDYFNNKKYGPISQLWFDIDGKYGDKVIKIMTKYANNKLAYTESWIE